MKKGLIALIILLSLTMGTVAYAGTGSFGFVFSIVGQKDESGLESKDDMDKYAYVRTVSCMSTGTTGTIYVGYRVRTSSGAIATQYRTFPMVENTYGRLYLFEYTNGPVQGNYYKLIGQISDKSTGTTNGVNPSGRWTP